MGLLQQFMVFKRNERKGVPAAAQWIKNPSSIHKDVGLIPGLSQWVKDSALTEAVV